MEGVFVRSCGDRMRAVAAIAACLVILGFAPGIEAQGGWRSGRATFYGNEPWLWSIHEGSCEYYYIWPDEPLGWDVAALPDAHYEYDGSCGRCYEVACDPMWFKDNYGNELDRTEVCHDPTTSVVVRITDTCPCNYGDNYYSNKRWCCGDMDHLDISVHTFEKLADMKWGVIGLKYRPVPCDYTPENPAPAPANPFPGVPPPPGAEKPWPPRFVSQKPREQSPAPPPETPDKALEPVPAEPEPLAFSLENGGVDPKDGGAAPEVVAFDGSSGKGGEKDGEQEGDEQVVTTEALPKGTIMHGGLSDDWQDQSWWVDQGGEVEGPTGQQAHCKRMYSGGAVAFYSDQRKFDKTMSMEFWVKVDGGVPDVNINLEGPKGSCRIVKMQDLAHSGDSKDGFVRYDLWLGLFDRSEEDQNAVQTFSSSFQGCGGNIAGEVNKIVFRNDLPWYEQEMCLDGVRLMGDLE